MRLDAEDLKENSRLKVNKPKGHNNITIIGIIIAIIITLLIIFVIALKIQDIQPIDETMKVYIDGKQTQMDTSIFLIEGNKIYVSVKGISNIIGYESHSGEYKIEAEDNMTKTAFEGISMQEAYNNGYPNSYGNILNLRGKDATGVSQLFLGWDSGNAIGAIRYRSMRDSGNSWSSWGRIYTETGLYLSSSGSSGTITLSENVTNFSYIEIFGHTNSGENVYTKVCNANGKTFNLEGGYLATNNIWQEIRARFKVNGTTISKEYEYYINTTSDGGTSMGQQGNNVFIDRVVGLR